MKRLTEYTIPETGFSVVAKEKYKHILMEEKPSVEKIYNRLKKIEDILGDEYDLDHLRKLVQADREQMYMEPGFHINIQNGDGCFQSWWLRSRGSVKKEYIDRAALKKRFQKRLIWLEKDVHDEYSKGLFHGCETDMGLIDEIPDANVVEVVSCKNCQFWQDNNGGYPHPECRWGKDETPDADDYCSYGQRKEG